ncbi:hypothetical protein K7432_004929 [Basidiobolus ranarum]|uniref:Uncharacterized protein n=1 Tax=Basidiobolus ranarum TaxID=34480 RepID=A0ABR2W4V0_9FUNG
MLYALSRLEWKVGRATSIGYGMSHARVLTVPHRKLLRTVSAIDEALAIYRV